MIRKALFIIFLSVSTTCFSQHISYINSGEVIAKGIELYDSGKYDEAVKKYLTITPRDTNYVSMLTELALTYIAAKENDKAIEACDAGLKIPSKHQATFLKNKAIATDHKGDIEYAVKLFKEAIEKYPLDYSLKYNLGITYHNHKDYDKAIDCYFEVLSLYPFHAGSHLNLAIISILNGRKVRAMLALGMYMTINNKDNNRLVLLEKFLSNQTIDEGSVTLESQNAYDRLDQIIRAKIAMDKNYKTKIPVDAAIVRQYQLLFEQLGSLDESADRWGQYYIPIYKAIQKNEMTEPFTYHLLSSADNEKVKKWIKKSDKELGLYYDVVNAAIKTKREIIEVPKSIYPEGKIEAYYYSNNHIRSIGKYLGEKPTGHWIYFYENGEKQAEGNYKESGKKFGIWKYFDELGKTKSIENEDTGAIELLYPNGKLREKFTMINDSIQGELLINYRCGTLKEKIMYEKGKRTGLVAAYYPNGQLKYTYNNLNELATGEYTSYYQNGVLETKMNYKKDLLEGLYTAWYENGKVESSGNYKDGKREGLWIYNHANGRLNRKGNYVLGEGSGEWIFYNERGVLMEKRNFNAKGDRHGDNTFYFNGKVQSIYTYKNSLVVNVAQFDESGKEIGHYGNPDGNFAVKVFYPNGTLSNEGAYKKGKPEGIWKRYFYTGNIQREYHFEEGKVNGSSIEYFPNGQKKYIANYKDDELDGLLQEFFIHGQLKDQGYYQKGKRQQQWLSYNENGMLSSDDYYINGDQDGINYEYSNGKLLSNMVFENGMKKETSYYDAEGKIRFTQSLQDANDALELKFKSGKTAYRLEFICGEYDGTNTSYFPDGQVYYTLPLSGEKRNGVYQHFNINNQLEVEGTYVLGKAENTWKGFYSNGAPEYTGNYLDGNHDSTWVFYHPHGKISQTIEYLNDERQGITKNFNAEGQPMLEKLYDEGQVVAYRVALGPDKFTDWKNLTKDAITIQANFENGKTASVQTYKNGLLDGYVRMYFADGKLFSEHQYKDGDDLGSYSIYYPNGKLREKGNYKFDNLEGEVTFYNEDGSVFIVENYSNGLLQGSTSLYKNGTITKTYNFSGGKVDEQN